MRLEWPLKLLGSRGCWDLQNNPKKWWNLLTFQHFQEVLGHIPTDCLKVGKLKEVWSFQTTLHFITPANGKTSHRSVMVQKENKHTTGIFMFGPNGLT